MRLVCSTGEKSDEPTTKATRVHGENKPRVRIFTVSEHGQNAEILQEILSRDQEVQEAWPGRERFTSLGESDQASVRWRTGNVLHAFIVASGLSGLDVVRIEVEAQKVLQGLHIAKKNTGTCVDLGLGGSARARRQEGGCPGNEGTELKAREETRPYLSDT
jgi:hypothetical protein